MQCGGKKLSWTISCEQVDQKLPPRANWEGEDEAKRPKKAETPNAWTHHKALLRSRDAAGICRPFTCLDLTRHMDIADKRTHKEI